MNTRTILGAGYEPPVCTLVFYNMERKFYVVKLIKVL